MRSAQLPMSLPKCFMAFLGSALFTLSGHAQMSTQVNASLLHKTELGQIEKLATMKKHGPCGLRFLCCFCWANEATAMNMISVAHTP